MGWWVVSSLVRGRYRGLKKSHYALHHCMNYHLLSFLGIWNISKHVFVDCMRAVCLPVSLYLTLYLRSLPLLQLAKLLMENLENYESAVGDPTTKSIHRIAVFPPAFQAVPRNPVTMDLAFNSIDFPSLENRMKKDKKGLLSRFWG